MLQNVYKDLQAFNLSGYYPKKSCTPPPSCTKPQKPTIYFLYFQINPDFFGFSFTLKMRQLVVRLLHYLVIVHARQIYFHQQ